MTSNDTDTLLIGKIVRELELRMPDGVESDPTPREIEQISNVYAEFDARYQHRADYKLWRVAMKPYFAIRRPALWGWQSPVSANWGDWSDYADECATSSDPVLVWGAVALAPELIEDQLHSSNVGDGAPIWRFADTLRARLPSLQTLPQCPASCGIAAAYLLLRHQNLHHKVGRSLKAAGCEAFFAEFERWIVRADPTWQPGAKLNLQALEIERRGRGRLRVGHDAFEFSRLSNMMGIIRPILSHNITALNSMSESLLEKAYRYALTAWLTARARRIDEMIFQEERGYASTRRSQGALRKSFEEEFECHLKLSNAARDAGHYLEASKFLYLLYRLIPDQFRASKFVQDELKRRSITFRYILEAGLEVDPRYDEPQDPTLVAGAAMHAARLWQGRGGVASLTGDDLSTEDIEDETGFMLRVRRDQARMTQWKTVIAEIPPRAGETPVGHLLTIVRGLGDNGFEASPRVLEAAFDIALNYGYVRSAGKILARGVCDDEFVVTPAMVSAFVREVRRCTQLDPFGMRHERLVDWYSLIRQACNRLLAKHGPGRWMLGRDRLWVHETLINRTIVHHRGLQLENAKRLFEKASGTFDLDALREFYDLHYDFRRRAPGAANADTVATYLRGVSCGSLPRPVALSLMRIGDAVSVVAIGGNGHVVADDVEDLDLDADALDLIAGAEHWFRFESSDASSEIGWPASFRRLATAVLRVAEQCDPEARVLLMSMDTSIAELPWQNLIGLVGGPGWLASIVPSLSGLTLKTSQDQTLPGLTTLLSDEPCDEVARVVSEVLTSTGDRDLGRSSLFIAAGHGLPPAPGGLPALRLGSLGELGSLDSWMPLLGARLSLFHCCHGGAAQPLFMEEFGGIAGLALCLGSKTVIAPVTEVLASTAIALQRGLFADLDAPVGVGYLEAIRSNPSCALYNLYGDPFQPVRTRPTANVMRSALGGGRARFAPAAGGVRKLA